MANDKKIRIRIKKEEVEKHPKDEDKDKRKRLVVVPADGAFGGGVFGPPPQNPPLPPPFGRKKALHRYFDTEGGDGLTEPTDCHMVIYSEDPIDWRDVKEKDIDSRSKDKILVTCEGPARACESPNVCHLTRDVKAEKDYPKGDEIWACGCISASSGKPASAPAPPAEPAPKKTAPGGQKGAGD